MIHKPTFKYMFMSHYATEVCKCPVLDECSYTLKTDVKMGDHPVIWINPQKRARNVYFQFGHSKSLFENPAFLTLFENALKWTLYDVE